MALVDELLRRIRGTGPLTVAQFMDCALYDPAAGYYATAAQRSGRAGDFATSVDAGPLFGELLAELVARAYRAWRAAGDSPAFDIVEAGAGNGRLMRDLLDELERLCPEAYGASRVRLVERSDAARAQHPVGLGPHAGRLQSSVELPPAIDGVLVANELLDAMPAHRLVRRGDTWREVYVDADAVGLTLVEGGLSSPGVAQHVAALALEVPEGSVIDVSPAAVAWVRDAARRMRRGLMAFIDYGEQARGLFAGHHLEGTLVSYARHLADPPTRGRSAARPPWLEDPGRRDLTVHVDFSSVSRAAEAEGWKVAAFVDQMRLLIGLGLGRRLSTSTGAGRADLARRLAAKTLASPTGLGATHRALLLTRGVGDVQWLEPL